MSGAAVRYDDYEDFYVVGHGSFGPLKHVDGLGGPLEALGPASITAIRAAVKKSQGDRPDYAARIYVSSSTSAQFDWKLSPLEEIYFEVTSDGFFINIDSLRWRGSLSKADVIRILEPVLRRNKSIISKLELDQTYVEWGHDADFSIQIKAPFRGKTIADGYALGVDIKLLLETLSAGGFTLKTSSELVRAGRPDLLIGQSESSWLEAKSAPYDLSEDAGKIELAQDVARFANSEHGGMLVVGLKTKKSQGEVLSAVRPINLGDLNSTRYRQILDARIFPPVEDLSVETVALSSGRGVLLMMVPKQPEELKPFLVHGAIVGKRVEGAFISIVRRRGETSVPISGPAIHAMLAAGRALLRRPQDGADGTPT